MVEFVKDWAGLIAILISIGGSLYAFLTSGSKANTGRIAETTKKLIDHDRRIQSLEDEMKHLPSKDMAHRLAIGMTKMNGRLDTLNEKLKPIDAISKRLQEWALENGTNSK